ncbi:lytic transglycosylase domain-containing protein [Roseicella frigidaeris]|uniref:lytic transglycosylase domain-containing protein n=1 Tax=Roseicella frigidaeris TaxID=2230885 RepID=UPI001FB2CDD5|nr:lytic transglycosylase domain-containing protein [Roseicella frigidaeris]
MNPITRRLVLASLALVAQQAAAQERTACTPAVAQAEREAGLPPGLLHAIARTESGRRDPLSGRVEPWPWALNAAGMGLHAGSRAEAIATVATLQGQGIRSIDIGCLQVNLLHHPAAFGSLEEAFDPLANARYAARFLRELHQRGGDWDQAIARYHSATPERGTAYRLRVLAHLDGAGQGLAAASPSLLRPAPVLPMAIPVFVPRALAAPGAAPPAAMARWLPPVFIPARR